MAFRIVGPRKWTCERDEEGYRTYKLTTLVVSSSTGDGPATALQTPGLPLPGTQWSLLNDRDPWCWCRPDAQVTPLIVNEPGQHFEITQTFSNKPLPKDKQKCQDNQVEDPLLEPHKISGSFQTKAEEATHDRYGFLILNSAHEQIHGSTVEFDETHPTVKIVQNVASLNLPLLAYMNNKVNAFTLWGLPPRCIKCTIPDWERKYHGQCSVYYTRTLEFAVNYKTWDRDVLDEGTKALHGKFSRTTGAWELIPIAGEPPDRFNPSHFDRFLDRQGNPAKVVLDGRGRPSGVRVVDGTFGGATATDIRTSCAATLAAVSDVSRLLVGLADLITGIGDPLAPQGGILSAISPLWRAVAQRATQASTDSANTVRDAATSNTLATNNGNAASIQSAVNRVVLTMTTLATQIFNINVRSAYDESIPLIELQRTVRNAADRIYDNAVSARTQATATKTLVDAAMRRIQLDVNFTGTGTGVTGNIADPGTIHIEKYDEADFTLLGIPLILG